MQLIPNQTKRFAVGLRPRAFTIIELIIVVTLIGVMAAFAIPNYNKAINKAHYKDSLVNLSTIYASEKIYFNANGKYLPDSGVAQDVNAINTGLGLGIIANGLTYACTGATNCIACAGNPPVCGCDTYSCTATNGTWTNTLTQASATPVCAGTCP